ncbi:MAG: UDP-glucose 4-epimerase GalE [Rhodospirillaceae bacterium]|nr:UDP-glucose 4-epimerase GalE [Rhodospirillaceae bacterium]
MSQHETVLVTGGAGYVGSHVVHHLRDAGVPVVVVDDLSTGYRFLLPPDVPLVEGSIGDPAVLDRALGDHGATAVMHFAASTFVPESVEKPLDYYHNNITNSGALLRRCIDAGVRDYIYSSTSAVYGIPEELPVGEDAPTFPISPYGWSKFVVERILDDAANAHGIRYVTLRYFNVAGADPAVRTGETNPDATHLVKKACQTALGQRDELMIYGCDYPTADGTGIRDYVHPMDLAEAHLLALSHLRKGGQRLTMNCGYGHGFSVLEVIEAMERVTGTSLPVRRVDRRPGDPPAIFARAERIKDALGWQPRHDSIDTIVSTALAWERKLAETPGAPA